MSREVDDNKIGIGEILHATAGWILMEHDTVQ
jgi:hypothetical protein